MLQIAEKDIRVKERTIKIMDDYIIILELRGYNTSDNELMLCKKRLEKARRQQSVYIP